MQIPDVIKMTDEQLVIASIKEISALLEQTMARNELQRREIEALENRIKELEENLDKLSERVYKVESDVENLDNKLYYETTSPDW